MNQKRFVNIIAIIGVVIFVGIAGYFFVDRQTSQKPAKEISNFEECAQAGYPVGESYTRQCWTPDGKGFVEKVKQGSLPIPKETSEEPCIITGCSGQICAEEEVITTCEFRPEYACYKDARCGRQENGKCGWTMTKELNNCLAQTKTSSPACTQEAKLCPDGSAVGRTGPNCEFAPCP